MNSSWQSDEGILDGAAQPTSLESSMPGTPRPRKKVEWYLPGDSPKLRHVEASNEQIPTIVVDDAVEGSQSHHENRRYDISPDEHQQPITKIETPAEKELRRGVHEIFAKMPPLSRVNCVDDTSRPIPRPRGVLRVSGNSTPNLPPSPPRPDMNDGIKDYEDKWRSATSAQRRADMLSKSLGDQDHPTILSRLYARAQNYTKGKGKATIDLEDDLETQDDFYHDGDALQSGQTTPDIDHFDYVPKPNRYMISGLSALNMIDKVRGHDDPSKQSDFDEEIGSEPSSGFSTPTGSTSFYENDSRHSSSSISDLLSAASSKLSHFGLDGAGYSAKHRKSRSISNLHTSSQSRPKITRSSSSELLHNLKRKGGKFATSVRRIGKGIEIKLEKHVQETKMRQKYLLKLCQSLMTYGAPTHRMEEYMKMSARVLEIEAQFLYIPGCMLMSFDDSRTHTTEVRIVRCAGGIDLGRLRDTHEVYKEVVHDLVGVEEACERLNAVVRRSDKFSKFWLIVFHGMAAVSVSPFAFGARPIDMGPIFILGTTLGVLRLVWANSSTLYANCFEIVVSVMASFIARWLGSIWQGNLFCFAAIAQSTIVTILPGYAVLCASLELQSRSLVAGSVRMVYAIVYSLFLGFGLTMGTVLYGLIDMNATSAPTCKYAMPPRSGFLFVPPFAFCLMVLNQAKWKQMPSMMVIAYVGWVVQHFVVKEFPDNPSVGGTLGAFAVSVMANWWSRLGVKVEFFAKRAWHFVARQHPIPSIIRKLTELWGKKRSQEIQERGDVKAQDLEKQTGTEQNCQVSNRFLAGLFRLRKYLSKEPATPNLSNAPNARPATDRLAGISTSLAKPIISSPSRSPSNHLKVPDEPQRRNSFNSSLSDISEYTEENLPPLSKVPSNIPTDAPTLVDSSSEPTTPISHLSDPDILASDPRLTHDGTIDMIAGSSSSIGGEDIDAWRARIAKEAPISIPRKRDVLAGKATASKQNQRKVHTAHSLAAASMLPAIFVLVPSGLAVTGSLVSGILSADSIIDEGLNHTKAATSQSANMNLTTQGLTMPSTAAVMGDMPIMVGVSVVQVAIGITVGLFLGSLVVYPFGKGGKWVGSRRMRSGLFSF